MLTVHYRIYEPPRFKDGQGDTNQLKTSFRIGQKVPDEVKNGLNLYVEASGAELRFIKDNFHNLPVIRNIGLARQTWRGDFARFIVDNWI